MTSYGGHISDQSLRQPDPDPGTVGVGAPRGKLSSGTFAGFGHAGLRGSKGAPNLGARRSGSRQIGRQNAALPDKPTLLCFHRAPPVAATVGRARPGPQVATGKHPQTSSSGRQAAVTLGDKSSLLEVAISVGDALRKHRIRGILTGGACASIYSGGQYVSADADFVLTGEVDRHQLDTAMASVGFARDGDRYVHPKTRFFVEFPRGPLAIGADHRVRPVLRTFRGKRALVLSATDSCRDRLAAYYHWNDRQSLEVAVAIARKNKLNWKVLRDWSELERFLDRLEEFKRAVDHERRRPRRRAAGR